jgi:AraC-like DNA-binding protein
MQPASSVANFDDPQPFQTAIRAGEFEVLPTVRGDFRSELIKIDLGSVWTQRAGENLPLLRHGAIRSDRVIIVLLPEPDLPPLRYCGMEVGPRDIVVTGSQAVTLSSDAASAWASMSLEPETFAAAAEIITGREIFRPTVTHLVRPEPEILRMLSALHRATAELARADPALLAQPEVARAFECQLTEMMVRSLGQGESLRLTTASLRQRTIIARFADFLEVRRGQPVYLIDICKAVGVSERTLRSACQEQFGLSPTRYLWLRRMYLARRRLTKADTRPVSVTEVAMANGFWELGRFATEYRSLFGETPSMTLRRAS